MRARVAVRRVARWGNQSKIIGANLCWGSPSAQRRSLLGYHEADGFGRRKESSRGGCTGGTFFLWAVGQKVGQTKFSRASDTQESEVALSLIAWDACASALEAIARITVYPLQPMGERQVKREMARSAIDLWNDGQLTVFKGKNRMRLLGDLEQATV